ncbi:MAG: SIMPL domain-containing protein [Culicoidibacterales bacterium]
MERTIKIIGIGVVNLVPDYVVISLKLGTLDQNYAESVAQAAEKIQTLQASLSEIGFKKADVKTTNFKVQSEYNSKKDSDGNYQRVFIGFACTHQLQVGFDFTSERLGQVLQKITQSLANPEFEIHFKLKDEYEVKQKLIAELTTNATQKAEALCQAMGVKLGVIQTINQSWSEINLYSHTRFDLEMEYVQESAMIEITPDDVKLNETATFVWSIE